jgi:hypothetical protein
MEKDYSHPQDLSVTIHNTLKAGLNVSVSADFAGWDRDLHSSLLENIGLSEKTVLVNYLPYYSPLRLAYALTSKVCKFGGEKDTLAMWQRRAKYLINGHPWRSEIPESELNDPTSIYYLEPELLKQYQEKLKKSKPEWEKAVVDYPLRRAEALAAEMIDRVYVQSLLT